MKEKLKKCNRTNIGGQAVLEGVMMRGASSMATSVRDEDGNIRVETERIVPIKDRNFLFRTPIIRGAINFFTSLVSGTKTLMRSAEVYGEEEPTKFDNWLSEKLKIDVMDIAMTIGVILGLALSVFLFVVCPQFVAGWIADPIGLDKTSVWFNLIEGGIRILIFIGYILLTSLFKDIKRTYMYHGAEHKTISCFECGLELTVENVRKCSRVHDRCGTTFMFFVMFISIIVFSIANAFIGALGFWRVLVKIALLPVVAGLSYELLKLLAKTDSPLVYPIKLPGLLLQRITTKEPDDDMIEVAINSFKTVLEMDADPTIKPKKFITALNCDKLLESVKTILADGGVTDTADAEWIVSIASGIQRSEVTTSTAHLSPKIVEKAQNYAEERATGKPLWYVIGDTEFYGYKINVNENVLIPRPETEELVQNALDYIDENKNVLDLCTGSGAIAIAIKKQKNCNVTATDVSEKALETAKENAELNETEIQFVQGDLFENVNGVYDVIVTNPPYIRTGDIAGLQKEVSFEPVIALDGGEDGLDFYKRIANEVSNYLADGGVLLTECGYDQAQDIKGLFEAVGFTAEIVKDLNGVERIVKVIK